MRVKTSVISTYKIMSIVYNNYRPGTVALFVGRVSKQSTKIIDKNIGRKMTSSNLLPTYSRYNVECVIINYMENSLYLFYR